MGRPPNSGANDSSDKPTKTLEQLVAEYPHVQFYRDLLGMQRDAIAERAAIFERHWESLGTPPHLSFVGPKGPAPA